MKSGILNQFTRLSTFMAMTAFFMVIGINTSMAASASDSDVSEPVKSEATKIRPNMPVYNPPAEGE